MTALVDTLTDALTFPSDAERDAFRERLTAALAEHKHVAHTGP